MPWTQCDMLGADAGNAPLLLVLMCHGFAGHRSDWAAVLRCLRRQLALRGERAVVVRRWVSTCAGTEVASREAAEAAEAVLGAAPEVSAISIVGHSFGGVYGRRVAQLLHDKGVLGGLRARAFVSVASPHLGVRRPPHSLFDRLYPHVARFVAGKTGAELLLEDGGGVPALAALAAPGAIAALRQFGTLTCFGNVANDMQVPFRTSCIVAHDPFPVRWWWPTGPTLMPEAEWPHPSPRAGADGPASEDAVWGPLGELPWRRVAVTLGPANAHMCILGFPLGALPPGPGTAAEAVAQAILE